jgi:hypothetical protein
MSGDIAAEMDEAVSSDKKMAGGPLLSGDS